MRAWFASRARLSERRTLGMLAVVRVHRARTVPTYRQPAYPKGESRARVLYAHSLRTHRGAE